MPWDNARPRSRKYGRPHARDRQAWASRHSPTDLCGWCRRPLGPMGPKLHLAHDPSGTRIVGFWHARCNLQEAGKRARAMQEPPDEPDEYRRPGW